MRKDCLARNRQLFAVLMQRWRLAKRQFFSSFSTKFV